MEESAREIAERIVGRKKKAVALVSIHRESESRAFHLEIDLFNSHGAQTVWGYKRASGTMAQQGSPSWKYFRSATWFKPVFVELSWSRRVKG